MWSGRLRDSLHHAVTLALVYHVLHHLGFFGVIALPRIMPVTPVNQQVTANYSITLQTLVIQNPDACSSFGGLLKLTLGTGDDLGSALFKQGFRSRTDLRAKQSEP